MLNTECNVNPSILSAAPAQTTKGDLPIICDLNNSKYAINIFVKNDLPIPAPPVIKAVTG